MYKIQEDRYFTGPKKKPAVNTGDTKTRIRRMTVKPMIDDLKNKIEDPDCKIRYCFTGRSKSYLRTFEYDDGTGSSASPVSQLFVQLMRNAMYNAMYNKNGRTECAMKCNPYPHENSGLWIDLFRIGPDWFKNSKKDCTGGSISYRSDAFKYQFSIIDKLQWLPSWPSGGPDISATEPAYPKVHMRPDGIKIHIRYVCDFPDGSGTRLDRLCDGIGYAIRAAARDFENGKQGQIGKVRSSDRFYPLYENALGQMKERNSAEISVAGLFEDVFTDYGKITGGIKENMKSLSDELSVQPVYEELYGTSIPVEVIPSFGFGIHMAEAMNRVMTELPGYITEHQCIKSGCKPEPYPLTKYR